MTLSPPAPPAVTRPVVDRSAARARRARNRRTSIRPGATRPGPVRPPVTGRRSVMANAASLGASQLFTWGLALAVSIVQARRLGPEGLGQLRLALSLWGVAEVLIAFGAPTLLTIEVARNPITGGGLVGRVIAVQDALYVLAWVGVMGFALAAGYPTTTLAVVAVVGASSIFNSVCSTARAALCGLEQMQFVAVADMAAKALFSVVVIGALVAGADVVDVAVVVVAGSVVNAMVLMRFLRRFPTMQLGLHLGPSSRDLVKRGSAFLAVDGSLVIYQQVDIIVISLLVSGGAMGWYSSANTLFGSLLFIPTILMTSVFPVLARLHESDPAEVTVVLRRAFASLVMVGVPIGLGTAVMARPVSVLLFGDRFGGTAPVLAVLGVVLIVTFLNVLLGRYALVAGHRRFFLGLLVVAAVATVPLDLVLVPLTARWWGNGAVGGAISYLLTETAILVAALWKVAPAGLLDRAMAGKVARCLVAGGVMTACTWPLRNVGVLPVVVGAAAYVAVVMALGTLDPEELDVLRRSRDRVLAMARGGSHRAGRA